MSYRELTREDITDVRIKIERGKPGKHGALAFCEIVFFDSLIVRDLKIIGSGSSIFVAMPSRKLMHHCDHCGVKNVFTAKFCQQCGNRLPPRPTQEHNERHAKLYFDIVHPLRRSTSNLIQRAVIEAYYRELELASRPGYVCRYNNTEERSARSELLHHGTLGQNNGQSPSDPAEHVNGAYAHNNYCQIKIVSPEPEEEFGIGLEVPSPSSDMSILS